MMLGSVSHASNWLGAKITCLIQVVVGFGGKGNKA